MPLSINVGLSRKASKDYQSTGVSINVNAELDQSLLARPDELQRAVDALYAQAEQAIDRQVKAYAGQGGAAAGNGRAAHPSPGAGGGRAYRGARSPRANGTPRINGAPGSNGSPRSNGHGTNGSAGGSAGGSGGRSGGGAGGISGGGGGGGGGASAGMTESQRRAIESIARRLNLDAAEEVRHEFGFDLDRLTLREASRVIDHLKSLSSAPRSETTATGSHHASTHAAASVNGH